MTNIVKVTAGIVGGWFAASAIGGARPPQRADWQTVGVAVLAIISVMYIARKK